MFQAQGPAPARKKIIDPSTYKCFNYCNYHVKFQDAEGLKKRYIRHRSLDCASSLNFYSDSTRCFLSMTEENRKDFRPINQISHQIYAT